MSELKILHLEDSDNDSELLRDELNRSDLNYIIHRVDNKADYMHELLTGRYDIIIADYSLPSFTGFEALQLAEENKVLIPFIFVSGTLGEDNAVDMLKRGASDYLLKGNLKRLGSAIKRAISESSTRIEKLKAEENLRNSLSEKELLLREIHHRVKNNLQIISSLIRLQAFSIKNTSVRTMLLETNTRVMAMSLIHQKLYQSESLAKVNFCDYPRSLVNYLIGLYSKDASKIKTKIYVDQIDLDMDTSIPCGLLINEVITNSLKHAFDENGGEIMLELRKNGEGKYRLVISDDGKGMGFDVNNYSGDTLGIQLIRSLVSQLNGSMKVDDSGGTQYTITFGRMDYQRRL